MPLPMEALTISSQSRPQSQPLPKKQKKNAPTAGSFNATACLMAMMIKVTLSHLSTAIHVRATAWNVIAMTLLMLSSPTL